MPTLTRCPACGATVPENAGWCSLCHADLRPEPAPAPRVAPASDVVPGAQAMAGDVAVPASGRHRRQDDVDDEPAPAPAPRRSRSRASSGGSGRHAAGGRRTSRGEAAVIAEGYGALQSATADQTPHVPDSEREEVERLADSMLSRLAVAESRESLFDPDEVPGGRWGFAAAAAGVITLVLLLGSVLVNAVVNR